MARIETDPNYSNPTFPRATAPTDLFHKEDVQSLAAAVSTHNHTTGWGAVLPAAAITPGLITSTMIADGTIQTADLADACVVGAKIAGLTVTANHIMDGQVVSSKIPDGQIVTRCIADGNVTTSKIASGITLTNPTLTNPIINGSMSGTGNVVVTNGIVQVNNGPLKVNGTAAVAPTGVGPEIWYDGTAGNIHSTDRGTGLNQPMNYKGNPLTLDGSEGGIRIANLPGGIIPGSKYLVVDPVSGAVHVSALGPGS